MKEIGEQFREKREEIGISIEEVSNGTHKVFKDILDLKDMVRIYAKYLGLDDEKLLEQLDDFIFEKTSKISVEDIEDRLKEEEEKKKQNEKKIHTPYTLEVKQGKNLTAIIIGVIILFILVLFYILLRILFL